MTKQEKGYTPDQIKDAEKLCRLIQKVPDAKRHMFSVSVLAYMNGFEAGLAAGHFLFLYARPLQQPVTIAIRKGTNPLQQLTERR